MTEITKSNLDDYFDEIAGNIDNSVFISIDCEFSALYLSARLENSLFDTPPVRYQKIRENVRETIPIQIGITAFHFDKHSNKYIGKPYQFYIFPFSITENKSFICQSSAFYFLSLNNFDFNKFVYSGLPYVNERENRKLENALADGTFLDLCKNGVQNQEYGFILANVSIVTQWYYSQKNVTDELVLCDISERNTVFLYIFHKELRQRLPKKIWTYTSGNEFKVKKVTRDEYERLENNSSLDTDTLNSLRGFTRIYNLLKHAKRPIVGHNLFLDLALMINTFDNRLPKSYTSFKKLINSHFPEIYDTKHISFELQQFIPEENRFKTNGLDELFAYFSREQGRHLVKKSPEIGTDKVYSSFAMDHFHNAVYDCYCTGYCFVRMAHFLAVKDYINVNYRDAMSKEHMTAISRYKNCINIIRATVSHLCLDGPDPKSKRPPCLIIQSLNQQPVNITKITHLLNQYGSVEIRPYSFLGTQAIAAVANYSSARRILGNFQNHDEFKISQFSLFKHSAVARLFLWTGLIGSSGAIAYLIMSRRQ